MIMAFHNNADEKAGRLGGLQEVLKNINLLISSGS
jgi:hypothetical protein